MSLNWMDPGKGFKFTLRTDASNYAIGAVLEQTFEGYSKPVAFWSRKLTPGQRKWSPREQETYAIVSALKKFAGYIGLRKVSIVTDHECLKSWYKEHVDTPSGPAGRRGRWHEFGRNKIQPRKVKCGGGQHVQMGVPGGIGHERCEQARISSRCRRGGKNDGVRGGGKMGGSKDSGSQEESQAPGIPLLSPSPIHHSLGSLPNLLRQLRLQQRLASRVPSM